jgi:hypothetical protein
MTVINPQAAAARNRSEYPGFTRAMIASEGASVLGMAKRRQQELKVATAYRSAHPNYQLGRPAKKIQQVRTRRSLPEVTRPTVKTRPQAASKPRVGNAFTAEQQNLLMSLFS